METVKFLQNIGSSRDCDVWMAQLSQHVNGIIFQESRNPSTSLQKRDRSAVDGDLSKCAQLTQAEFFIWTRHNLTL